MTPFSTTTHVNTRKPHRCVGCHETFPAGSFMRYWAGVHEGEFQSNYFCCDCVMFLDSRMGSWEFWRGDVPYLKREAAPEMFEEVKA